MYKHKSLPSIKIAGIFMTILPEPPLSLWLDTYGSYTSEPPLNEEMAAHGNG
jgi:hypothetical protein